MTNYEKIMAEMTIEEMAELRTYTREYERYGELEHWSQNDAGTYQFYDDAIAAEIEWLKEEAE